MPKKQILLALLSDGKFHSGEDLGRALGISRAAIWKSLKSLPLIGVEVDSVRGRGYKLRAPIELLDRSEILASVGPPARESLGSLEILRQVNSTNNYLFNEIGRVSRGSVCLAEIQTAGRGRRGRQWISPFGSNIYLSLLWSFNDGPAKLSGLSLAIAVGCARALQRVGVDRIGLKWPNDVLYRGRKLAGILLEVVGESNGPCHVVIGVGVNIGMPREAAIGQPWSDVRESTENVSRSTLAGVLIEELILVLKDFELRGFAEVRDEWIALDEFAGRQVSLEFSHETIKGVARGIDPTGFLLLQTSDGLRRFASGEVSLRGD
jgi:BirA family biotin operon repressor/biotin-[acetyl-CoA-carboxylase] ligase